MRVEFIELLRCPACREPSALVTVTDARDGDRLVEGTLGCPACLAEYVLRDGVVDLSMRRAIGTSSDAPPPYDTPPDPLPAAVAPPMAQRTGDTASDAMRLAALLNLTEPGLRIGLCGTNALNAESLGVLAETLCLAINAPPSAPGRVSTLLMDVGHALPLAAASLHGLVLDAQHAALVLDATRVVRVGGRVVAPVGTTVPPGLRELARDATEWVAQVDIGHQAPVTLTRGA